LSTLFFAPYAFICIIDGTCVIRKDGDGISVYFFHPKLMSGHVIEQVSV